MAANRLPYHCWQFRWCLDSTWEAEGLFGSTTAADLSYDFLEEVAEEDEEEVPEEVAERVDSEKDRLYDDPLVGRNLRGIYKNGVFNGVIKYFNKVLNEYNVVFEDGSEDYLREEDINGVDVILM